MRLLPTLPLLTALLLGACGDVDLSTGVEPVARLDLVYESTADGGLNTVRLMTRDAATGAQAPLFGLTIHGASPTVSADGSRVVYVGSRANDDYDYQDLFVVTRGGAPQRIPLPGSGPEFAPALSPDGTRVAFIRLDDLNRARLYVADITGANEREVAPALAPALSWSYASPAWSPDGTKLLFSAGLPGALHLWTATVTGGRLSQLTDASISDIDGAWSPDGRRVAYIRTASPAASRLMTLDLLTGEERELGYSHRNRFPAWSPDGLYLAFVSNMHDNADLELYTVRRDGAELTRLTDDNVRQQSPKWLRRPGLQ